MSSQETLDRTYALIEAAALAGERCPQSKPFGPLDRNATRVLAKSGRIKIEIFMHNWRVATIMEGHSAGKQTKMPEHANPKPYKIIYKDHVLIPKRRLANP